MNSRSIQSAASRLTVSAVMFALLQGCAAFSCDNYRYYDDILDSWVGDELSSYERRHDLKPLEVMDRPGGKLEYTFDTPYYDYTGTYYPCRTLLEVDGDTGEIVGWRYTGDCHMHGHCAD